MKKTSLSALFIALMMAASPSLALATRSFDIAGKRLTQIRDEDHVVSEKELYQLTQSIANEDVSSEYKRQEINKIINLTLSLFYKRDSIQEASSLLERPRDLIKDLTKKIRLEALKHIAREKRLEEQRQKELLIKESEAKARAKAEAEAKSKAAAKEREEVMRLKAKLTRKRTMIIETFLDESIKIGEEIHALLKNKTKNYRQLGRKAVQIRTISVEFSSYCTSVKNLLQKKCIEGSYIIRDISVSMASGVAGYLFESKQFSLSKKLYRDIIIHHAEPRYRSYVKKAEFALEDIKEINGQ